jgi:hypothetical protein
MERTLISLKQFLATLHNIDLLNKTTNVRIITLVAMFRNPDRGYYTRTVLPVEVALNRNYLRQNLVCFAIF